MGKEERSLERTEMQILMGISLKERKRNEYIRRWAGMNDMSKKAHEARLLWLKHVLRREEGGVGCAEA